MMTSARSPPPATISTRPSQRVLGLKNAPGEQNCFLNVVIQALWRQRACRRFFSDVGDSGSQNPMLAALTSLMTQYTFVDNDEETQILPPDQVRTALAEMFAHLHRFQLREMDDAGESFEAILAVMHDAEHGDQDRPCKDRRTCLGHQVFALDYIIQRDKCARCGNDGHEDDGPSGTWFTYHLYAQEACAIAAKHRDIITLSRAMHDLDMDNASAVACEKCHSPQARRSCTTVLSMPQVFCMNIVWPSQEADKALLMQMLRLIATTTTDARVFKMDEAFHMPMASAYELTGMICFYPGGHYVFFGVVSAAEGGEWVLVDDHQVKRVGTFDLVVQRCDKAKYQPVCLFYERKEEQQPGASARRASHRPPPPPPSSSSFPISSRTRSTEGPPPVYSDAVQVPLSDLQRDTAPAGGFLRSLFASGPETFTHTSSSSSTARTLRRG